MNYINNQQEIPLTSLVHSGGCAAKMDAVLLREILGSLPKTECKNLLAGIDGFEDAAVYKVAENLTVVESVDFFPPLVDDAFLFGQIAATNAITDIYAMGAQPIFALNVLGFPPCNVPLKIAEQILLGASLHLKKVGVVIAGGHTIDSPEIFFGLAVTGLAKPSEILTNRGAKAGDAIILTKPIGTGVALQAHRAKLLSSDAYNQLLSNLTEIPSAVLSILKNIPIHAATDVTGFALIGHLQQMAVASGLSCQLIASAIPFLPEVLELASQGFLPAKTYANRHAFEQHVTFDSKIDLANIDLLFDPQTSGGLLLAIDHSYKDESLKQLNSNGVQAAYIGAFTDGAKGTIKVKA